MRLVSRDHKNYDLMNIFLVVGESISCIKKFVFF